MRFGFTFESAIELYKKALELESQLPVVNFALALAYQGIGKFDLAIDYANKTLKLDKSKVQFKAMIETAMRRAANEASQDTALEWQKRLDQEILEAKQEKDELRKRARRWWSEKRMIPSETLLLPGLV